MYRKHEGDPNNNIYNYMNKIEGIYPNRGFFTNNTKASSSFVGVCHLDCDSRQEFVKENLLRNLKKVDISQ